MAWKRNLFQDSYSEKNIWGHRSGFITYHHAAHKTIYMYIHPNSCIQIILCLALYIQKVWYGGFEKHNSPLKHPKNSTFINKFWGTLYLDLKLYKHTMDTVKRKGRDNVTALIVTGVVEGKLQRSQWRPGQSTRWLFRFCDE